MSTVITSIDRRSPAERAHICVGERLCSVNDHEIVDVLDYRYYCYDARLTLVLEKDGTRRTVHVKKEDGEELGLNFDSYLMDEPRPCSNHCIFCFVDQMPSGCRSTLYFKDDDARLSFLMGNYITLTNLSEREAQRIIDLKISPINVSVHATDGAVRSRMLGNKAGAASLSYMRRFGEAGIVMNGQIVLCPGFNDGAVLQKSMEDIAAMNFASCAIVPVGLTKFRDRLAPLRPVTREEACEVIDMVEAFGEKCLKERGTRLFFCSDELYIRAERELPDEEFYEGYVQIENGVGMLRSLITEFEDALKDADIDGKYKTFTIATGKSAEPYLRELVEKAMKKCSGLRGEVVGIWNDFFGHTIDVAGLVTGGDLVAQLRGRELGERILLPVNMLRHGETIFLDDVSIEDVERALGRRVVVVEQDGYCLADALFEQQEGE